MHVGLSKITRNYSKLLDYSPLQGSIKHSKLSTHSLDNLHENRANHGVEREERCQASAAATPSVMGLMPSHESTTRFRQVYYKAPRVIMTELQWAYIA